MLRHTREILKVVKVLIKSKDGEIQVFAVRSFITLSELTIALVEALAISLSEIGTLISAAPFPLEGLEAAQHLKIKSLKSFSPFSSLRLS